MEKCVALIVVLLFCVLYTVAIAAQDRKSLAGSDAAKAEVLRLGFGKRVDVRLQDGATTGGRITGLAEDRFVLTNSKGAATPITYAQVARITKQKEKLGIFHKPWVGIMFTAAGVGTLIVLALQLFD
jgi:hypothetical protein